MTVHRDKFLVNKTNRRRTFQFYWYYESTCFGQPFCPSSGVLSRTSALVQFMRFWWPFATRSKRSSKLHKLYQCRCMSKHSWWWAERLPKTCRIVIPTKLEPSASVGFIHEKIIAVYSENLKTIRNVFCQMQFAAALNLVICIITIVF